MSSSITYHICPVVLYLENYNPEGPFQFYYNVKDTEIEKIKIYEKV